MSNKLSTPKLKELISQWLSEPEIREYLSHHSEPDGIEESEIREALDYTADIYNAPKGSSQEQLEEHIWNLWKDGNNWKRGEKHKLKDSWDFHFDKNGFAIDVAGGEDKDLIEYYVNHPNEACNCIMRTFYPDNELADNYRLEVVTTPDDSKVVGWTVIVD